MQYCLLVLKLGRMSREGETVREWTMCVAFLSIGGFFLSFNHRHRHPFNLTFFAHQSTAAQSSLSGINVAIYSCMRSKWQDGCEAYRWIKGLKNVNDGFPLRLFLSFVTLPFPFFLLLATKYKAHWACNGSDGSHGMHGLKGSIRIVVLEMCYLCMAHRMSFKATDDHGHGPNFSVSFPVTKKSWLQAARFIHSCYGLPLLSFSSLLLLSFLPSFHHSFFSFFFVSLPAFRLFLIVRSFRPSLLFILYAFLSSFIVSVSVPFLSPLPTPYTPQHLHSFPLPLSWQENTHTHILDHVRRTPKVLYYPYSSSISHSSWSPSPFHQTLIFSQSTLTSWFPLTSDMSHNTKKSLLRALFFAQPQTHPRCPTPDTPSQLLFVLPWYTHSCGGWSLEKN